MSVPVDWKPKRAVQAKVRDFHKPKQRMIAKACRGKNTLLPFTNGDFSRTFNRQWSGFPSGLDCHRVLGFIPPMARLVHSNINSKEICRVFVLRCQSASNLTCLVLFHRVTCHMQFVWSFKSHIHTFIRSCIHASIHQYFHILAHSSVHNAHIHTRINSHMIASVAQSLVWSYLINSVINRSKWQVLHNGQLEIYLSFFQVASPS